MNLEAGKINMAFSHTLPDGCCRIDMLNGEGKRSIYTLRTDKGGDDPDLFPDRILKACAFALKQGQKAGFDIVFGPKDYQRARVFLAAQTRDF